MAERVTAYPFPEPESYPRPEIDVEPGVDFGASVSLHFYEQLSFRAGRALRGARSTMQAAFTTMKDVMVQVVEERPIQLVAGVAIAAFIAGAGLRMWRSHHE